MFCYGVPWLISTLAASLAAGCEKHWHTNELLSTSLEWLAENGGYYAAFFAVGRFMPKAENESKEPLAEMLFTEAVDIAVRFSLLWLGPRLFASRELGVAVGSSVADILFAITLSRSHQLVEVAIIAGRRIKAGFLSTSVLPTKMVKSLPKQAWRLVDWEVKWVKSPFAILLPPSYCLR